MKIFSRFGLLVLAVLGSPIAIASLTPAEVSQALIGKSDGNRANAIASMARSGQISSPISGADGGAILEGATQGARASAIGELAPLFKADLSGQEAAAILGSSTVLSDGNRANAIAALIRAGKLGADFPDKPSPSVSCDAPSHVIDKPSPTCRERWQTALFRENIGKIFFAFSEYVDAWQHSAETGEKLTNAILTLADMVKFGWDFKKQPDLAKRTVVVLTKGNSLLLMLGFSNSETLGAEIASEAIQTIRNGIETLVEYGLEGSVKASGVPIDLAKLANKLLSYANTVRYSRMRNAYTVSLEYLRRLYRMGGDHAMFAQTLGLPQTASVRDCIQAVNAKSFGFPTQINDASAYDPDFVEKLVNHWVSSISEYAALKAP